MVLINSRIHTQDVADYIHKCKDWQKKAIADIGLSNLLNLTTVGDQKVTLIDYLVQAVDADTKTIMLYGHRYELTPQLFGHYLGLNQGTVQFVLNKKVEAADHVPDDVSVRYTDHLAHTSVVTCEKIDNELRRLNALEEAKPKDCDEFKRCFMLYVLMKVVLPTANNNMIRKYLIPLLDAERIGEYDWATYGFNYLMDSLKRFKKNKIILEQEKQEQGKMRLTPKRKRRLSQETTISVEKGEQPEYTVDLKIIKKDHLFASGCVYFFQLFYLEQLELGASIGDRSICPLARWTRENTDMVMGLLGKKKYLQQQALIARDISNPFVHVSESEENDQELLDVGPLHVADPTRNLVAERDEETARDRAVVVNQCRPRFEARRMTPAVRQASDPNIETSIYSTAASFPPHDVRYPALSTFIPNAATLMYFVQYMDFTMSSTKQWTDNCMGWVPPYAMIYVATLFYIQTLRAMDAAGAISPSSEHYFILSSFLTQFPVDNLWIPGPLVQFFKNLSSFWPTETEAFGNVTPTLPETPGWSRQERYSLPDPLHLHLPHIPAIISRLHTVCATAMVDNMTEDLFINHVDGPRFCASLFGQNVNHSDVEERVMSSPGMNLILSGDLRLWKNAAAKLDYYAMPRNLDVNVTAVSNKWNSFLKLDSAARWMGPLSAMMAKYCQFWRASAPLADCPPNCSSAGAVICMNLKDSTMFDPPPWTDHNHTSHQIGHYNLVSNHQLFLNSATTIRDLPLVSFYAANTYNVNMISFAADRPHQLAGQFWDIWPNTQACNNISILPGVLASIVRNFHSDSRLDPTRP